MIYLERPAKGLLQNYVRSLWYCRAPGLKHTHERVLPNGCIQVVVNLARNFLTGSHGSQTAKQSRALIIGTSQSYHVIATQDLAELVGFVLHPDGFPGLFGDRADLLFDRSFALQDIWPCFHINQILEAPTARKLDCLEHLLLTKVGTAVDNSALVKRALRTFMLPDSSVASFARSENISERRFSQAFREQVGLSPKAWYRIRRFQSALENIHQSSTASWTDLALRCGYYDQSHFINDFRAFSGINPTAYSSLNGPWKNHLRLS